MTVNPLNCDLSNWDGNENHCRWCNCALSEKQKRWHSGACLDAWRLHHRYFLSRQLVFKHARRKCSCVRADNEQRHVHCADCGLCEAIIRLRGYELTCDHIIPRRGDKSRFSCKHHPDNLQVLCSNCHAIKTKQEEKLYGN